MKTKTIIYVAVFLLLVGVTNSVIEIDKQGVLRNATNNSILMNGTYTFNTTFYLLSDDTRLFSDQQSLVVQRGIFNHKMPIGSLTLSVLLNDIYEIGRINAQALGRVNVTYNIKSLVALLANNSLMFGGHNVSFFPSNATTIASNTTQATAIALLRTDNTTQATEIDVLTLSNTTQAAAIALLRTDNTTQAALITALGNGGNSTAEILFAANSTKLLMNYSTATWSVTRYSTYCEYWNGSALRQESSCTI